jgi:hypothetical protein
MDLSATVLGKHTAELLTTRAAAAVLTIGRDKFTRADLAGVACFNYVAALNLTRALAALDCKSVKDAFDNISPSMLAVPHVGAVSLAVLGAAFEARGIGGDAPLIAWCLNHRDPEARKEIRTFDTIKHHAHDQQAASAERRTAKSRKRARRDEAHRQRVDRLTRRTGAKLE